MVDYLLFCSAIFQCEMDSILYGLKDAFCYLCNLLSSGIYEAKHLKNLRDVLTRLKLADIKLHSDKSTKQNLYLGESKVEAHSKVEIHSFPWLVTYYTKFRLMRFALNKGKDMTVLGYQYLP